MSQRLALMQLHNALRGEVGTEREAWRMNVETLGFERTLLPDFTHAPVGPGDLDKPFVAALNELAGPTDPDQGGDEPRSDEVAPIEKLDVLIRLLRGRVIDLTDGERAAVEAVAKTLLDPAFREDSVEVDRLLTAIDQVAPGREAIQLPDLDGDQRLQWAPGPRAPRSQAVGTVDSLLATPNLKLATTLAEHSVVVVDACIYKALVRGEAEYPVHLRTMISIDDKKFQIGDFDPLLEPQKWPTYNSFWAAMEEVKKPAMAGIPGQPMTVEQEVTGEASPYATHMQAIGWVSVGTYHERVGLEDPALAAGQNDKRDLYPQTYLYFSCDKDQDRSLLTYTLLPRQGAPLGVDDGCIEIKQIGSRVEVITTKSLYVSGQGKETELGGILAYLAAHCGWGANTLSLVSNAVLSKY